jgi:Beta-lactamase
MTIRRQLRISIFFLCLSGAPFSVLSQSKKTIYYPAPGDGWQRRRPEDVGMNSVLLEQAVAYAKTQGSTIPADFSTQVETFGRVLGPLPKSRGETNGIIIRHGYIVAEWGDTNQISPTYSVAKSFLSTLVGLAVDRGMIKSVHEPLKQYATDAGYDSPHNAKITWENHLQQTSEWEGTMFGKNSNFLGAEEFGRGQRRPREIKEPGTYWEYNDVRINRMSLTLLEVWKKPLPQVLKDEIMDRIGASHTWQYHGYFNSQVVINGKNGFGQRRHTLGWRLMDRRARRSEIWLSHLAQREVERQTDHF